MSLNEVKGYELCTIRQRASKFATFLWNFFYLNQISILLIFFCANTNWDTGENDWMQIRNKTVRTVKEYIFTGRQIVWLFFSETNPPVPLINRLKWFCWKICFRGYISEISDSAQANTARSQKINFVKISCDTLPLTHMYFFFSEGYYFMQRK